MPAMVANSLSMLSLRLARAAWHLIPLSPEKRGRLANSVLRLVRPVPIAVPPEATQRPPEVAAASSRDPSAGAELKARFRRRCARLLSDFLASDRRIGLPT